MDRGASKTTALVLLLAGSLAVARGAQLSVDINHDMTKPTLGLHGQSSSQVTYDDKNGLNLKGTISDLLGPPIKIANGFHHMLAGSQMAGLGSSLKAGGAVLGIDAKMLEAAGGGKLLKGGLLMGGSAAKVGAAKVMGGLPGKKIASIIEVPVKVVAMKDLAAGKTMIGLGKVKEAEAQAAKAKGEAMQREGDALKTQGLSQVMQGAQEGMQNIGGMVQQATGNAATAVKLLPLLLDIPAAPFHQMQEPYQQQQQQHQQIKSGQRQDASHMSGPLTGGSLFGGLASILPGAGAGGDPFGALAGGSSAGTYRSPFSAMFGGGQHNGGYAAVMNTTSPLMSLLTSPGLSPIMMPLGEGPLAQGMGGKQAGLMGNPFPLLAGLGGFGAGAPASSTTYSLFPGLRVTESTSSQAPSSAGLKVAQSTSGQVQSGASQKRSLEPSQDQLQLA